MTEEARKIVEAIKEAFEVLSAMELPAEEQKIEITRDDAMTLIAELEQVTSERDGLNIMLSQALAMLEARTRERDAAFRYIKRGCRACSACRYGDDTPENNEVCDKCIPNPEGYSEWQWEGVEVTDNAQKGSDAKS